MRTGEARSRGGVGELVLGDQRVLLARPLRPLGARAAVLGRVALAVAFAAIPPACWIR